MEDAAKMAYKMGSDECLLDIGPPALFLDEPLLMTSWDAGRHTAIDSEEGLVRAYDIAFAEAIVETRGGGDTWFEFMLNTRMDSVFSSRVKRDCRDFLLEFAFIKFGYLPPELRARENNTGDDGFCWHGIEKYACPAGCGEG